MPVIKGRPTSTVNIPIRQNGGVKGDTAPAPKEEDKPYIDRGQPPNKPLEPGMETKDNGLVPSKEIKPTEEGANWSGGK